ncbi:hypothetical protein IBE33_09255 [Francisella philomiragia]|uniref:Uncharacterized protein n=1 Tax=Francisella tularensis subsp. novicida PA10-7858 TaxID=1386968 RepID=V5TB00_FRANO|nr:MULTISPECIES: hypothetical protein [Francisella]AHB60813.1 hypothetical protein N894_0045 [Francisella tularensis subsp. novicida PA10-7858]MBK2341696.1 hypothetical protein [Francisella philomiragia]
MNFTEEQKRHSLAKYAEKILSDIKLVEETLVLGADLELTPKKDGVDTGKICIRWNNEKQALDISVQKYIGDKDFFSSSFDVRDRTEYPLIGDICKGLIECNKIV